MKKKASIYEGSIRCLPQKKIYINVDYLPEGRYELHIIHKGKVIKTILFRKNSNDCK